MVRKRVTVKKEKVPSVVVELLEQRGIEGEKQIEQFLYPKLINLPKPEDLLNACEAAELVAFYLENNLQIIIWGDYDVDGITSTALLIHFFRQLHTEVLWHIPNRLTDGYGLNLDWIKQNISRFSSKKFLLITVDNGTSSKNEIAEIRNFGGDVIVTDHHAIPQTGLPNCIIVNPEQKGCAFQKERIAGVGVAFYLASAIRSILKKTHLFTETASINMKPFLAFVALGTVADMVEMTETNRILVRAGMEELNAPKFVGLSALLEASGMVGGNITSDDIAFQIGPRINAAGRLGKSKLGVEVLISGDLKIAMHKAEELNNLNYERKKQTAADYRQAESKISIYQVSKDKVCVVYGGFHVGVAGIVASKLVEKLKVPAIILAKKKTKNNEIYFTGSGRSIEGVDLIKAIQSCADILESYGGHNMAAGITVSEKNLEKFISKISSKIRLAIKEVGKRREKNRDNYKQYDVDCSVDTVMNKNVLHYFALFEPFGPGNPQPVFFDSNAVVVAVHRVGREGEHVNITFRGQYSSYKGIGFGLGKKIDELQDRPERELFYSLTKNRFRGTVSWQIQVHSI